MNGINGFYSCFTWLPARSDVLFLKQEQKAQEWMQMATPMISQQNYFI